MVKVQTGVINLRLYVFKAIQYQQQYIINVIDHDHYEIGILFHTFLVCQVEHPVISISHMLYIASKLCIVVDTILQHVLCAPTILCLVE